jgi:hypothetical protein
MAQNQTETVGPVPEDNQPGHQPAEDQDKPDLDRFAQRFGIPPEGEASNERAPAEEVPIVKSSLDDEPATAVADVIDLTQERFSAPDVPGVAEVRIVEHAPVLTPHPARSEPMTLGPLAEVVDAVWDFSRAGLRLFVVTPIKVSWSVGGALKRVATGRSPRPGGADGRIDG